MRPLGSDGDNDRIDPPLEAARVSVRDREIEMYAGKVTWLEETEEERKSSDDVTDEHWYKKPIGILGLSICGALLSAAALWVVAHYFGS